MRTRRPLPCLAPAPRAPLGPALALAAAALGLGLWSGGARAQAPKKDTYALGWSRLAGAEPCIGSRDLAAGVEKSLKRRVFVSAARADRNVEGRVGPRLGGGWTATVQIADAKGRILGTRELMSDGPNCRDLDEAITLSVALMIDSNLTAPPVDPLESTAPAGGADAASGPDKDDPWAGNVTPAEAPARASAEASAQADRPRAGQWRGPGEEGFEVALTGGYSFGRGSVPIESEAPATAKLGFGLGVRAGYQFPAGIWLGVGFVHHTGGEFTRVVRPEGRNSAFYVDSSPLNSTNGNIVTDFNGFMPSLEAGYAFVFGPVEARPYLGFGFMLYDLSVSSAYGSSSPNYQTWPVSPSKVSSPSTAVRIATWPGASVVYPSGPLFVGVDVRLLFVVDSGAWFSPSLTAGARF